MGGRFCGWISSDESLSAQLAMYVCSVMNRLLVRYVRWKLTVPQMMVELALRLKLEEE